MGCGARSRISPEDMGQAMSTKARVALIKAGGTGGGSIRPGIGGPAGAGGPLGAAVIQAAGVFGGLIHGRRFLALDFLSLMCDIYSDGIRNQNN